MATAYLICGSTGAGKTTYARSLAREKSAQVFSIDEWMQTLFWADAPKDEAFPWAIERVQRCERQIFSVAERLLAVGVNVVLDLGFSKREQRERIRSWVETGGFEARLHFLDIPAEVRRDRVKLRNEAKSGTYQFDVPDSVFDWMESYFEAPSGDELASATVIR
jgi:predicted kinase